MARKPHFPRKTKARKFVSGQQIAQRSRKLWVCEHCDWVSAPGGQKPGQCPDCGRLAFLHFDSQGECGRWHQLRLLGAAKDPAQRVTALRRQVRFSLNAYHDGQCVKVGEYWADFVYECGGETIVEDYKGGEVMTELASWKLRHMAAQGNPVKISK